MAHMRGGGAACENRGVPDHPAGSEPVLPDDVDPELWFVSPHTRCDAGRDYLFDKHWLTHPGRMAAYCPHDPEWPDYRISLGELPENLPSATRYWVKGFLAGNLPPAPVEMAEGSPETLAWERAAQVFAETGEWTLDSADSDDEQDGEDEEEAAGEWVEQPSGSGSYAFIPAPESGPQNRKR
jgi:hypothetical protein